MVKKIFIILFYLLVSVSFCAQNRNVLLHGKVSDINNKPISGASIIVNEDLLFVTKDDGFFEGSIPPGSYTMTIVCFGYETKQISIEITKDTEYNFKITPHIHELSTIEVKGKSKIQRLQESAYSVNALDIKSKVNELNSLNSIIGRSSGVKIREEGGVGSDYELSINGLYGNAIRYFIDGIPLSTIGSGINLANFPVNLVERVEIYKGFVPSELGADALGGAINIITKKNVKKYIDASYGIGSFNTHKADFNAQYIISKTKLIVRPSFGINYSKNNYKMRNIELWDNDKEEFMLKNAKRFHDDYFSFLGQLEFGVINRKWADSFFLSGSYSFMNKELQNGVTQKIVYGKAEKESKSFRISGNYRKNNFILKNLSTDISFSHTWDHSIVIDTAYRQYKWDGTSTPSSRNEILGKGKSKKHTKRPLTVGRINLNYRLSDIHSLNLNYLLDHVSNDRYDKIDMEFKPSKDKFTKHVIGLSYTQTFWNDRLSNVAFLKNYTSQLSIDQNDFYWITGATDIAKSTTTNKLGYGIGSRFRLTNYLAIKASFEHSIRLPLAREVLGNGTTVFANLKLKPENSNNINIGLLSDVNLGKNHNLGYEFGFFNRHVKDYIRFQASPSEDIAGQYENRSNVTVIGVEGEARYSYMDLLQVIVNCSYQGSKDKTRFQTNGKPSITYDNNIPNLPWLYSNLEINVRKQDVLGIKTNQLKLAYYFQYVHWYYFTWEGYGTLESKSTIPTQCINSASLTYSLKNEKYNISLECNNMFNRLVYDNLKLQKPGRSFFCKFRLFIN